MIENIRRTMDMMLWAWRFIRPWRWQFMLCSILCVMQNAWMSITSSYMLGQMALHAVSGDFGAMLGAIALVCAVVAVGIPVITASGYFAKRIHIMGLAALRKALFGKLCAMPPAEAQRYSSGDLSTRMSLDAENTSSFFGSMMTGDRSLFALPVSIILSTAFCIARLPAIGALNLLFLLLSIYVNLACIRRQYTAQSRRMRVLSTLTQHMSDIVRGSQVVRLFGLTEKRCAVYEEDSQTAYGYAMMGAHHDALRSALSSAIQWSAILFTLIAGGVLAHNGVTDLGTVVFVVMMQSQINNDVLLLTNLYGSLQHATVAAERVKEIIDTPGEIVRKTLATPSLDCGTAIRLHDVTLSYQRENPVIKGLSLTIQNGEKLAIVGGSGGGKTTLIKYLLELMEEDSGSLFLFGQPRQAYAQPDARALMAYVPQNSYLFDGTIRENIAWGAPHVPEGRIQAAVDEAGLRELIDSLPDGLDTHVGEHGTRLSGGQRQRMAVARAMVRDAPILILDEATSALDGESEQGIQLALERAMAGRTAIIIAHRLSTVCDADRIIVMEHGEIVEEGSHRELLVKRGRYAELYRQQFS